MADEISAPADGQRGTLRALAGVLTTLITVAAIAGSAYWLYREHRRTSLITRSYRAMTLIGRQYNSYLDGYRALLVARTKGGASDCKAVESLGPDFLCDSSKTTALPAIVHQPGVVPVDATSVHYTRDVDGARVHLCTTPGATKPSSSKAAAVGAPLCVSRALDGILPSFRWTLFGFDALVVATTNGQVVAQAGSLIQRITSLGESTTTAPSPRPAPSASPASPKQELTTGPAKQAIAAPRIASNPETIVIAGRPYLLFAWGPLPAKDAAALDYDAANALWLVGLAPETEFNANVQRIPYAGLMASLVLLLILALSWQLLKLRWLAPQERLQAVDIRLLGVSILALVGTCTILVCAYRAHGARVAQQDADLDTLADDLELSLRAELRQASDQLLASYPTPFCAPSKCWYVTPARGATTHLKNLLLLDYDGAPQSRCTPTQTGMLRRGLEPAELIRTQFDDREYFKNAQSRRMWRVFFDGDVGERSFAVEALRGRISNAYELAVALPLASPGSQKPTVAVISTNARPFITPLLPEGFGFAVIDELGGVLFHSENSRNLSENLFEESEDSPAVKLAATLGRPDSYDMSYSGNEYTARVHPLQHPGEWIPWSIVVFRDQYVLRALNSDTLVGATTVFGCHLLAIVGSLVLLQLIDRRYHFRWLWPERRRSTVLAYVLVAGAVVTTGVLALGLIDGDFATYTALGPAVMVFALSASCLVLESTPHERRWAGAAALLSASVVTAICRGPAWWLPTTVALVWAITYLVARLRPHLHGVVDERSFRAGYVVFLAAIVFILAGFPAAIMVGDSASYVDHVFGVLSRQDHTAKRRQRDAAIMGTDDPVWVQHERCRDQDDVYDLPGGVVANGASAVTDLVFTRMLPALGELSQRLRVVPTAGERQTPPWSRAPCCDPARSDGCVDDAGTPAAPPLAPSGAPHVPHVPWDVGAAAAVVALGMLLVLADTARRIFLLDIDGGADADRSETSRTPTGAWRLERHGGATGTSTAATLEAAGGTAAIAAWRARHPWLASYGSVEVRNVDVAFADEGARTALLALLEELVHRTEATIVLHSTEHPLFVLSRSRDKPPAPKTEDAKAKETPPAMKPGTPPGHEAEVVPWLPLFAGFKSQPASAATSPPMDPEVAHRFVWQRRSRAERLALRQLADEDFLNPNNTDVVRDLFTAGVLQRDRGFAFRDPSFAAFVRRAVSRATVTRWEHEGVSGGWESVRTHLGAVLAVAGTFIFLTQPALLNTVALTVAGVTAGVPTLMKLVSMFGGEKRDAR